MFSYRGAKKMFLLTS